MRLSLRKLLLAVFVSGLAVNTVFAQGNVSLDFESDPADIDVQFFGTAEWVPPEDTFDGNGYLSVTNAVNSERGAIVFPDLSDPPGSALTSFSIKAALRVGDGTDSPADGFSFNLVTPDDPVLDDGEGYAASPAGEGNLPEEGTTTGLAIGFDEWQSGGADPNATATDCGSLAFDCVGISVRVDGELLGQAPFPTRNGALEDTTSLQTGPQLDGSGEELGWANLIITVTPDPQDAATSNLAVSYKGRSVFNENLAYTPAPGLLVFAGRTGGSNGNHHIDNVEIITDFTPEPVGDFDLDGDIDFADFLVLGNNMNTEPGLGLIGDYEAGDINFSASVDLADFVIFRGAYEKFNAGPAAAAAVPEPTGSLLAAVGLLGFLASRRRR